MNIPAKIEIILAEKFPTLTHPPIVEAAIDIRAQAEIPWEEAIIFEKLKPQLLDYPKADSKNEEINLGMVESSGATHKAHWKGLRFHSEDQKYVAQFNRNGFVFSRLRPYENWERFSCEAMRLWDIYANLACPIEAQRIGLRFINRIELPPQEFNFQDYIEHPAKHPNGLELPFMGFLHHDSFVVPGHAYAINLIRTIQPSRDPRVEGAAVILDTDVTTLQPFELRKDTLNQRLIEMRWLKNKVFFGSVTEKALKSFD